MRADSQTTDRSAHMTKEAEMLALADECEALTKNGPDGLLKAKACVALINAGAYLRAASVSAPDAGLVGREADALTLRIARAMCVPSEFQINGQAAYHVSDWSAARQLAEDISRTEKYRANLAETHLNQIYSYLNCCRSGSAAICAIKEMQAALLSRSGAGEPVAATAKELALGLVIRDQSGQPIAASDFYATPAPQAGRDPETIEAAINAVAGVMRIEPSTAGGPIFDALRALAAPVLTEDHSPVGE